VDRGNDPLDFRRNIGAALGAQRADRADRRAPFALLRRDGRDGLRRLALRGKVLPDHLRLVRLEADDGAEHGARQHQHDEHAFDHWSVLTAVSVCGVAGYARRASPGSQSNKS
jgi:hypothetical protein